MLPDPLDVFKEPTSKGMEGKRKAEKGKGGNVKRRKGRGGGKRIWPTQKFKRGAPMQYICPLTSDHIFILYI